jgi:hypothetical protein
VLNLVGHLQVQPLNPADQLACEGVEVAAGTPLLLVHCATAKPLNLEEAAKRPTDFGVELEVSANAVTSSGKQLALEHAARVSGREVVWHSVGQMADFNAELALAGTTCVGHTCSSVKQQAADITRN